MFRAQPDITRYGPPRYGLTPEGWRTLCRMHQTYAGGGYQGDREDAGGDPRERMPRLAFARYLYRTRRLTDDHGTQ